MSKQNNPKKNQSKHVEEKKSGQSTPRHISSGAGHSRDSLTGVKGWNERVGTCDMTRLSDQVQNKKRMGSDLGSHNLPVCIVCVCEKTCDTTLSAGRDLAR